MYLYLTVLVQPFWLCTAGDPKETQIKEPYFDGQKEYRIAGRLAHVSDLIIGFKTATFFFANFVDYLLRFSFSFY